MRRSTMNARMGLAIVTFGLIVAGAGVASAKVYLVSGESPPEGNGASPNSQPVGRGGDGPNYGNVGQGGRSELRQRRQYPYYYPPKGSPY
jgi:hypothetical protein